MKEYSQFHPFGSQEEWEKHIKIRESIIHEFRNNSGFSSLKDLKVKISKDITNSSENLGVFAKKNFYKNELVEASPIFPLAWRSKYVHDPKIKQYAFTHNANCQCNDCKNHGVVYYIALGYSSLYNSKDDPDIVWFLSPQDRAWFGIAIRDIKKDQEIYTWYGPKYQIEPYQNSTAAQQDPTKIVNLDNFDWSRIPLTPTD